MNISINVYGCGREWKYEYMFRYVYAGVGEMKIHLEKQCRHMSRVMRTSIGTVTGVSIILVEQEKKTKRWMPSPPPIVQIHSLHQVAKLP